MIHYDDGKVSDAGFGPDIAHGDDADETTEYPDVKVYVDAIGTYMGTDAPWGTSGSFRDRKPKD